jgi:hypothetical protein
MRSTKKMRKALLQVLALASLALTVAALPSQAASTQPTGNGRPHVVTGRVTRVVGTSVALNGTVNPQGSATDYYFKYGPTATYGQQTTPVSIPAGTATVKVSQTVTGFLPGYHYRLVATNAVATEEGHDHVFSPKAKKKKTAFDLPKTFQPVTIGGTFVLSGSLTGTGNANREVVLQASAYPYRTAYADVGAPILTSATGAFSFRVANLQTSTKFRVATVATVPLYSLIVPELVQVRVILKVRSSGHPGLVRLYGTVSPAEVGAHVFFQLEHAAKEKLQDSEKPTKLEKPGKGRSERAEKPPGFVTRFSTTVKPGTKALARFSAIVSVRAAGHYRAFVAVPAGPLASGHSQTVTLRANPNLQKKSKKKAKA